MIHPKVSGTACPWERQATGAESCHGCPVLEEQAETGARFFWTQIRLNKHPPPNLKWLGKENDKKTLKKRCNVSSHVILPTSECPYTAQRHVLVPAAPKGTETIPADFQHAIRGVKAQDPSQAWDSPQLPRVLSRPPRKVRPRGSPDPELLCPISRGQQSPQAAIQLGCGARFLWNSLQKRKKQNTKQRRFLGRWVNLASKRSMCFGHG